MKLKLKNRVLLAARRERLLSHQCKRRSTRITSRLSCFVLSQAACVRRVMKYSVAFDITYGTSEAIFCRKYKSNVTVTFKRILSIQKYMHVRCAIDFIWCCNWVCTQLFHISLKLLIFLFIFVVLWRITELSNYVIWKATQQIF